MQECITANMQLLNNSVEVLYFPVEKLPDFRFFTQDLERGSFCFVLWPLSFLSLWLHKAMGLTTMS